MDAASLTFTNQGTAQAVSGGRLAVYPGTATNGGTLSVDGTNSRLILGGTWAAGALGTLSATNSGAVYFGMAQLSATPSTFGNAGGTLTLANSGGSWNLDGGTISGGTVSIASGAKLLVSGSSNNRLAGVTVSGALDLVTTAGAFLLIKDGLTLNGTATLGNSFTPTMALENTEAVSGSGTIVLPSGSKLNVAGGATATLGIGLSPRAAPVS